MKDSKLLEKKLKSVLQGDVRFDDGSRALYATDASNYRQVPIGVVFPKTVEDVLETVRIAHEFEAPILPRGAGTSLAGQCCNVAVVIDMSKSLNRILEIDPDKKLARVEPGVILDDLRDAAEKHGLTFGPDPATHRQCTIGGMIGNNACGIHSLMAGLTVDNVEELEILTYEGKHFPVGAYGHTPLQHSDIDVGIASDLQSLAAQYGNLIRQRFPKIPRRVSGYNLDRLLPENGFHIARSLVGTEGTCVIVTQAVLKLAPHPRRRSLAVLGFSDIESAADVVPKILTHRPMGLEGFDGELVEDMRKKGMHAAGRSLLPEGHGWLLVEFGAESTEEASGKAETLIREVEAVAALDSKMFTEPKQNALVWAIRESALGATARVPGKKPTWAGWEDAAVPPEKMGDYLREFKKLRDEFGYSSTFYGHLGEGCIHTRLDFDFKSAEGIKKFRRFVEHAADLVLYFGGSLSGEHGDGQSRAELLPKMFGEELVEAFRKFKKIWDPQNKMNPGKIVDPYRLDENLRFASALSSPKTHFQFPHDAGDFGQAAERCVGVGRCRKENGGTMCPSFMATREEKHSTRGRAHLLFEMLKGDVLQKGWRNQAVKESLDLCLSCKACKTECPVQVDMATYKAEFLSHYYERRLRPRTAYSMGLIPYWAKMGSEFSGVMNLISRTPQLEMLAKKIAGIAPQRRIPLFAHSTFQRWSRRQKNAQTSPHVLLWADTSTNYFEPKIGIAAYEVLKNLGFQVHVLQKRLCCGRPFYDFGMLGLAKKFLEEILVALRPYLIRNLPVVVLEPSCLSVFRDELLNFFPNDPYAGRLANQSFLLSEFLEKKGAMFQLPKIERKALIQGHCHHQSVLGFGDEESTLKKLGLDYEILDSGCCGMAGSFGFDEKHYEVSTAIGERVLLPCVREAGEETLIVADGFSCRRQIAHGTSRRALHLAEVIRMGMKAGGK